jgi:hypothetical protein
LAAQTDSGSTIIFFLEIVLEYTEIGRAPLINFQKLVLNKLLYRLKLFRKFKFNIWMTISGRKSVKKGQNWREKATNLVYNEFSKKKFVLANLKYINGYNMMKKSWFENYITLGLIFSHLVKLKYHFGIY